MTSAVKPLPGPARVAQVEGILKAEPVFADKLGPKDVEIQRRDGGKLYFHRLSYNTTLAIIESGKEPLQVPKTQVFDAAKTVLEGGPVKLAPAPAPAVTAAPAAAPEVAESQPAPEAPQTEKKKAKKEKEVAPVQVAPVEDEAPAAAPQTQPAVNVVLAVYSLVIMAAELAERDQRPGAGERRALLKKATDAYYSVLPS